MKIANLPRKLAESTWSPFQSSEVRDICNHLSRPEKLNLLEQAAEYGRQTAVRFALPCAVVVVAFIYSRLVGVVLLAGLAFYLLIFEWRRVRAHQARMRDLLCATEYARARGYCSKGLRMFAWPWSK